MYVLGIETSCDETGAAVVRDGLQVLSNEVSSSLALHRRYGGVIPEIASRKQLETIVAVTDAALKDARVGLHDIGLISVTASPGLLGSLLVGVTFARTLSEALGVPLVEVDHLKGHLYANFLAHQGIRLPVVALVVSGGHTTLFYVRDFRRIDVLGRTQDDACGEAFDKVAKMLGFGYPGGPEVESAAQRGNPCAVPLTCSTTSGRFDFSFSGIKTAVLYYLRKQGYTPQAGKRTGKIPARMMSDICASFQEAAVRALEEKAMEACRCKRARQIVVGGGVALNRRLRDRFRETFSRSGITCFFPPRELCTDNAAMIAGYGYRLYGSGKSTRGRRGHADG